MLQQKKIQFFIQNPSTPPSNPPHPTPTLLPRLPVRSCYVITSNQHSHYSSSSSWHWQDACIVPVRPYILSIKYVIQLLLRHNGHTWQRSFTTNNPLRRLSQIHQGVCCCQACQATYHCNWWMTRDHVWFRQGGYIPLSLSLL